MSSLMKLTKKTACQMQDEVGGVICESNRLVLSSLDPGAPCSGLRAYHKSKESLVEMKEAFSTSEKVERERE